MSDGGDEEETDKLEAEATSESVVSEDGANSDATGMSEEEAEDNAATEEFLRRFEVVETDDFSAVQIPPKLAVLIREKWQAFLEKFPTREQAGEAIYDSFMEEAPSLRPLFKTPRSVFGLRFIASLTNLMAVRPAGVTEEAGGNHGFPAPRLGGDSSEGRRHPRCNSRSDGQRAWRR